MRESATVTHMEFSVQLRKTAERKTAKVEQKGEGIIIMAVLGQSCYNPFIALDSKKQFSWNPINNIALLGFVIIIKSL